MATTSDRFMIPATDPEDIALLHFTSGTTGRPKGAIHVHDAVVAKSIPQPRGKTGYRGIALHLRQLVLGIAPNREVVLIRPIDKLRNSGADRR